MCKQLIIFLFIAMPLAAQNSTNELKVDSLSYNYYYNGNWKQLIELGKTAELNNIKFMYLEQRLGYANFMMGNYYNAIKHYSNALKYDNANQVSHIYLYYAANNIGDKDMAMFHASKFTEESKKSLKIKSFKLVDAVDFEYNYKYNNSAIRSNPNYIRIGINSQLADRLNVYQSISRYNQTNNLTTVIQQNEYFALMSFGLFDRTTIRLGYHYLNTKLNDPVYNYLDTLKTNIVVGSLTQKIGRFDLGISSSYITGDTLQAQIGAQLGVLLPGNIKPYFKTSVYNINRNGVNRIVFSQMAGILAAPKLWLQGSLTLGNLDNYVDNNGLYVYNSLDPTTFRIGTSLFWYVAPKITLFTNYTHDKKLINSSQTSYNQHSISGGLIWKL